MSKDIFEHWLKNEEKEFLNYELFSTLLKANYRKHQEKANCLAWSVTERAELCLSFQG